MILCPLVPGQIFESFVLKAAETTTISLFYGVLKVILLMETFRETFD
jgi:hypothetical protein